MKHHLMVGTWTPPGVIITVEFDDEALSLKLVKKTDIPEDEPISWMTFDVRILLFLRLLSNKELTLNATAQPEKHLRRVDEEMVEPRSQNSKRNRTHLVTSHGWPP